MFFFLKRYQEEIERCVACGICQAPCPTYKASSDETMVARGRIRLIKGVLDREIDITSTFREKMSSCTACMNCEQSCPNGIKIVDIINAARFESYPLQKKRQILNYLLPWIIKKGWPIAATARYLNFFFRRVYPFIPAGSIAERIFPFVRDNKKKQIPPFTGIPLRFSFPERIKPGRKKKARVLFFLGCMTDIVYQQSGRAIIEILTQQDMEVIIPKGLYCCGAPTYYLGDRDASLCVAKNNKALIQSVNPDMVLTNCATCGSMLTKGYSLLLGENGVGKPVIDVHKFLIENTTFLQYDRPTIQKQKKIKITYHDPCHLKRGQGVCNDPRTLLQSIPWVEFVEMKDADQCCGGAGMFSVKHYTLALEIAKNKIQHIKKTGATIVATGCPSCQMHITDALKREGLSIEVVHTAQILHQDLFKNSRCMPLKSIGITTKKNNKEESNIERKRNYDHRC